MKPAGVTIVTSLRIPEDSLDLIDDEAVRRRMSRNSLIVQILEDMIRPRRVSLVEGLLMKYFVLKPKGVDVYAKASRACIRQYANIVAMANPQLANQLHDWIDQEEMDYASLNPADLDESLITALLKVTDPASYTLEIDTKYQNLLKEKRRRVAKGES